jgi:DNA-binding CsgD family transcriptional regulator/PAS domain-containing protein
MSAIPASVPIEMLDLVGEIYQAALEPGRWSRVVGALSHHVEADSGLLFTPTEGLRERFLYADHNLPDDWMRLYSSHYWMLDAWREHAFKKGVIYQGMISTGDELIDLDCLHQTTFYKEFLTQCGADRLLSTILFDESAAEIAPRTHVSLFRNIGRETFSEADKAFMRQLMPHLQRALVLHWQLAREQLRLSAQDTLLDRLGYGLAMIDQDSKIVFMNPSAESLLKSADGLWLQGDRIFSRLASGPLLQTLILNALNGEGGTLVVPRPSGKVPYNLIASPLTESHHFAHLAGMPAIALLMIDPERCRQGGGVKAFAKAHHLTSAEARVLEALLSDESPKQIASKFDLSIHTVRSQLSSLFAKTGVSNQRELVALVVRSTLGQI